MKLRATSFGSQSQETEPDWWQHSPLFALEQGYAISRPGTERVFEVLWKPQAFAAWAYELVRGLPSFKGIEREIFYQDLELIGKLPPFPELTYQQRRYLLAALAKR